jgi:aminopeptidase N
MTAENSQTIYLKDYQEPAYLVEHVALEFDLHPTATRVRSTVKFLAKSEQQQLGVLFARRKLDPPGGLYQWRCRHPCDV